MRVVFAIILLLASFAEAKTMDASEKRAFLKAMQSSKFGHNINSDNIMKKLFAKAQLFKRRLNDGNEEAQWDNFGFDVSDYSVKYSGCASVQTYSDDLAEDEDSDTVLTTKRFVVFRLCPTQYCNKYSVSGCTSDYGEYLIDIDDYLDAVSEYYQQKEENYCNYCQPCWDVQQDNQQNGGGRRRLNDQAANEQDDQMNDAQQADNGEQDQMNDDQQADNEEEEDQMNDDQQDQADQEQQDEADQEQQQNQQQCDENACQDSYDVCYQAQGDGQGNEIDIREFLECSAVQVDDDTEYYLAPHCSSDGFTISVGVYSDEECTQFVGNQVSVSDVLGFDLDTDIFKTYFPKDCTSCKESENEYENAQQDNEDEDQINEMCENLYMGSAKCNKNFDMENYNSYQGYQQAEQEDLVCDFITSIVSGSYDESGTIVLDTWWYFNTSNWRDADTYMKEYQSVKRMVSTRVAPWQIAALVIGGLACLYMWVWACCLHGSLARKKLTWRPRRSRDTPPGDFSRQNSGIVMGRSRSGPGTTPLI